LLGDRKIEVAFSSLKLVLNVGEATSVFVSGGGVDGARIGERLEVTDWANNTGATINFNGKRFFAVGSLANEPLDSKAAKSALKFTQAIATATGYSFEALISSMVKNCDDSYICHWRAQILGHCVSSGFSFRQPMIQQ